MRVVVTGGSGYLGAYISRRFADRGDEVVAVSRADHALANELSGNVGNLVADVVTDPLEDVVSGAHLVIHAAGFNAPSADADPARALLVNGFGTRRILEACAKRRVPRVIYVSTMHVYGSASGRLDEAVAPRPVTDYGISKLAGEGYCHEALAKWGVETLVLRPANGFGVPLTSDADCWGLAIPDFCRQAFATGEIVLATPGTQHRVFMTLDDISRAVALLSNTTAPCGITESIYNVGSGVSLSIRAIANLVAEECTRVLGRVVSVRVPLDSGGVFEPPELDYDFSRLHALGFVPTVDLRSTIAEMAEYVHQGHVR